MKTKKLWILFSLLFVLIILLIIFSPESTFIFNRVETEEESEDEIISGDFNSQFTEDAAGWNPVNGKNTWSVENDFYQSAGLEGTFTSSKSDSRYSELTFIVRLRRGGSNIHSQGIIFSGSAFPISSLGEWNRGYTFDVTNNGYFIIGMYAEGKWTALTDWTFSPELTGWWNILKITSHGPSGFTQFFINGKRVAYGNLTTFDSGLVGFGFYCESSSQLYVDYAMVNTWAPQGDEDTLPVDGILVDDTTPVDSDDIDRTTSP